MNDKQLQSTNGAELAKPAALDAPTSALAEQVRAGVEARCLVAMKRPRDLDVVRQDLLKECKRPRFAEQALYELDFGEKVIGPSIRFAEACHRHMGNMDVDVLPIFDGPDRVKLIVAAVDLEKNNRVTAQVDCEKVVIRKYAPHDPKDIRGTRRNSKGEVNYIVRADEQAMRPKINAEVSKAMRTCVLRLIPGWLVDEALAQVRATVENEAAEDPDSYRRSIVDAFGALGVRADSLGDYLGHDLGEASPGELAELRAVWKTIKDDLVTWHEVLRARTGVEGETDSKANKAILDKVAATRRAMEGGNGKVAQEPQDEPPPEAPAKGAAKAKRKAKAKSKRKAATTKADPPKDVAADPLVEIVRATRLEPARAAELLRSTPDVLELLAQGYDVEPNTLEMIPPVGADG